MKKTVFCRFVFEGWHRWPTVAGSELYLGSLHRHLFHVCVWFAVNGNDRDIEFISSGRMLKNRCEEMSKDSFVESWSCEQWGEWILGLSIEGNAPCRVSVSEDGENGAELWK